MAPLEMPKNFRFHMIFPVHNLIHELKVGASSSHFVLFVFLNLGSKCVVFNHDSTFGIKLEMAKKDDTKEEMQIV